MTPFSASNFTHVKSQKLHRNAHALPDTTVRASIEG